MNNHRKGFLLTTVGGLALSFDVPLVRLGQGEMWSIIAFRSITTFAVGLALWIALRFFGRARPALVSGKAGLLAGLCYGLSTVTFLSAVFHTATANVVFIVAFTPMFAALLGWILLKERPSPATLITMLVMVVGVALIVSGGLASGHLIGDLLAALTALALACAITIGHATRIEMGLVPLLATIFPAAVGFTFMSSGGFQIEAPLWVIFDGAVMIPLAFWCLATGPKYLTGPEVGMFYLLETILAPVWVWIVFREVPSLETLAGGAILVLALVGYSIVQMQRMDKIRTLAVPKGL
ncbi:DMT family transporter [Neorhizobium lilium]